MMADTAGSRVEGREAAAAAGRTAHSHLVEVGSRRAVAVVVGIGCRDLTW